MGHQRITGLAVIKPDSGYVTNEIGHDIGVKPARAKRPAGGQVFAAGPSPLVLGTTSRLLDGPDCVALQDNAADRPTGAAPDK